MQTVNMLEAKSTLSRLVDLIEQGTEREIVIARNGRPAARQDDRCGQSQFRATVVLPRGWCRSTRLRHSAALALPRDNLSCLTTSMRTTPKLQPCSSATHRHELAA